MCCRTMKNHQISQKLLENEENLAMCTVILMAAFGTKNVHSAMSALILGDFSLLYLVKKSE